MHIVHTESSLGWGGQEIRILTESAGMIGRGHRVTLLTPPTSQIYTAAHKGGINVIALPIERKRLSGVWAVYRWLKENPDIDIINTHSSTDSWLVGLATLMLRKPPVIVRTRHISTPVHSTNANRWLYGKSARQVVTTGEKLRLDLIDGLNLNHEHVVSIPTGIDLGRFSPGKTPTRSIARDALDVPQDAFLIGIVATLRSWKGHEDLLRALDQLAKAHPEIHLIVAGDGPGFNHLKQIIASLHWASNIHLLGRRDDVPSILAAIDLFVLPSYANEGVPQAIIQAMAMELPVISTTIGSIPEAVEDGINGRLVPPRSPDLLALAIEEMKNNPVLRKRFAEAARRIAVQRYSLDEMVNAMLLAYEKALDR